MRKNVLLLVGLLVLCGCTSPYVIKMSNGMYVTSVGKPTLKGGLYYYKDASGQEKTIPAGRVREISPASMVEDEKAKFKPASSK
jgi:hypothetical protein